LAEGAGGGFADRGVGVVEQGREQRHGRGRFFSHAAQDFDRFAANVRIIAAQGVDERWDGWGADSTESIFSRVFIGPLVERFNRLRGRFSRLLVGSLNDEAGLRRLLHFAGGALGCTYLGCNYLGSVYWGRVYWGGAYFGSVAFSGGEDGRAPVGDLDFFMGGCGFACAAQGSREA
jgi:hypothetical protein